MPKLCDFHLKIEKAPNAGALVALPPEPLAFGGWGVRPHISHFLESTIIPYFLLL